MEAVRTRQATIDDLLERLLDKGIILNLDLVIGVAGIPLIAVNLRAAIAAIETMIDYGLMQAWDEQLRDYANAELQQKKLALAPEERVLLELYGSHWHTNGIYRAWRPGRLFLTDRRLILYRQEPAEVLFQTPLTAIQDLVINRETYFTGALRDLLYLALDDGQTVALYAEELPALHAALTAHLAGLGRTPAGDLTPFVRDQVMADIIGERVVAEGKMWWLAPAAGIHPATWRPGWLYLTAERLLWWSDFDGRAPVEIPLTRLGAINLAREANAPGDAGFGPEVREVLMLAVRRRSGAQTLQFWGDALPQWRRQIKDQVLEIGVDDDADEFIA